MRRRETPVRANRALVLLKAICTWADPDGVNPCRRISRSRNAPASAFFPPTSWPGWARRWQPGRAHRFAAAAIRLLVFTGTRLGEVLSLQWAWIDIAKGTARLPDSKTGAKTLHLPHRRSRYWRACRAHPTSPTCSGGRPLSKSRGVASARRPGLRTCTCTTCGTVSPALPQRVGWACRSSARCWATLRPAQHSAMRICKPIPWQPQPRWWRSASERRCRVTVGASRGCPSQGPSKALLRNSSWRA